MYYYLDVEKESGVWSSMYSFGRRHFKSSQAEQAIESWFHLVLNVLLSHFGVIQITSTCHCKKNVIIKKKKDGE